MLLLKFIILLSYSLLQVELTAKISRFCHLTRIKYHEYHFFIQLESTLDINNV